jgi:uncharacterized small protein (DUF1192 family)
MVSIEIPSKRGVKEMVKAEIKRQEHLFFAEIDKLRKRIALLNDEITILKKMIEMK